MAQVHDAVGFIGPDGEVLLSNVGDQLPDEGPVRIQDLAGLYEIFRPDGRRYEPTEWPVWRSVTTGEVVTDEEFHRITPDGIRRSFTCDCAPVHDAQGRIVAAVIVTRELTEARRALDALQSASRQTDTLLGAISDSFFVVDREWRYTYLNQRAVDQVSHALGGRASLDEILGRVCWEVFPEWAGTYVSEAYRQALDGQRTIQLEVFAARSETWLEARLYPSPDGVSTYLRDVTERKQATEQQAYHASLLDMVEEGVIGTDAQNFRVTAWNRGAERLYGFAAGEVLGRPAREVATYSGDQARLDLEDALLRTGRARMELTARHRDGSPIEVEVIAVAVRDEAGETTGYLGIHRDISERKRVTARLHSAAREQALLADLSLRALRGGEVEALLEDAVTITANCLNVELSSIAELDQPGDRLTWRAAFGWPRERLARAPPSATGAESLVGYVLATGGPVVSEDLSVEERFRISSFFAQEEPASAAGVVIPGPSEPFGSLAVASRRQRRFGAHEVEFLQAVATVIGIAVERSRGDARLESAREAERTRIARELHDDGLRELTEALGVAALGRASSEGAQGEEHWGALTRSLQRLGQQLRSAIYDLRLGSHEERPFPDLLGDLVALQDELAVGLRVHLQGRTQLAAGSLGHSGTEVLRIVREAVTNARRHAGATAIWVNAAGSTAGLLSLEVNDNGSWPDRQATVASRRGTGILGMLERTEELGATLSFDERVGGGTVVLLRLSLARP